MLNIGVIGCGYWGPNLVRNLVESRRCDRIVCCDLNEQRLERILARYPGLAGTPTYGEILQDEDIHAVVIATPVSTHGPLAGEALDAGKHVFVEKPMAGSRSEALTLIERSERVGRTLMVGHVFEYSPPVIKIKEIVSSGALGEIFYISSSRVNLGLHQKDVSVIWDLAPHDFSILFYWLEQKPRWISAFGRAFVQRGIPDVAFINLGFESGVLAHVQVSWLAPSKLRRTTVIGSQKMLVYDDTESLEKVKVFDRGVEYKDPETFGEYQLSYRSGDIVSPNLENYEPLGAEVGHFLDCVEQGRRPRSDGWDGLRVVEALEAAEQSLRNGGQVEEVA